MSLSTLASDAMFNSRKLPQADAFGACFGQ
jgi:hypothetical protein